MGKPPAFQFYVGDWLKDPALTMCSPATRGIWIDLLCAMHESDRSGQLSGTPEQLARVARCTPVQLSHALQELGDSHTADVTDRNSIVTLENRRMRREFQARKDAAERQKRHRGKVEINSHGDVTQKSHPPSSSSSSPSGRKAKTPPSPPAAGGNRGVGKKLGGVPEKNGRGRTADLPGPAIPGSLDTPEFRAAWQEWLTHRKEKRQKLTPTAIKRQLATLEKMGVKRATAAIEHSVANGYTGIFEPDPAKQSTGRARTDQAARRRAEKRGRDFEEPDTPLPEAFAR